MSALLDSLAATARDDARRAILDAAVRDGLPGPRSEAWKYTSLRALDRREFAVASPAPAFDAALLADIPAPRMVFVNGRFHAGASSLDELGDGIDVSPLSAVLASGDARAGNVLQRRYDGADAVFARLNAALADEGAIVRVAQGAGIDVPLHLVFIGATTGRDEAWHLRHLVELRAGASLRLVEHHLGAGDHAHLANAVAHVHLGRGARLEHVRTQHDAAGATSMLRSDAVLARDADYRRLDLELGAALSRHELNVRLEGDHARLRANGVLLADGRRHVDTRLGIEHIARDTACELVWRGVGAGRGRAVFHGGITIRAGADGSDADLSNKNLLLSDAAEIDTQPVLEIYADEVKAAHGATVGQLDPVALFYLRSRGLPQAQARRLLTAAFCREPLALLDDDALRERLQALLDTALARQAMA